jgi:hypothetical protein
MTVVYDLALIAAVLGFFLMALERTIASYRVYSYEQASSVLGKSLVAVSVIVDIFAHRHCQFLHVTVLFSVDFGD